MGNVKFISMMLLLAVFSSYMDLFVVTVIQAAFF